MDVSHFLWHNIFSWKKPTDQVMPLVSAWHCCSRMENKQTKQSVTVSGARDGLLSETLFRQKIRVAINNV